MASSRIAEHTALFRTAAVTLGDWAAPSLCDGWSRAEVIAHVARNAGGLVRVVRSGIDATGEAMYADEETRDAEILETAGWDRPRLLGFLTTSAHALDRELARLRPEHVDLLVERTPGGALIRLGDVPFLRTRELVYHHVDLDAGFGFADVDPTLLEDLWRDEVARVRGAAATASALLRLARVR